MARARNIKPSIFKNELLGVADPLLTLLFESLWCLADREGRLEDRPLRIKAETFPYREGLDINGFLTELQRLGFIVRYSVNGQALIEVVNFKKHQSPHNTEKPTELPGMESESSIIKGLRQECSLTPCVNGELPQAKRPDSLIPDSLNLIPDSGIPQPDPLGSDAASASVPPTKERREKKRTPAESETAETWNAYCEAYRLRYRVDPVRNATVNAQMFNFVRRLGVEESPEVARFYVAHNKAWYVQQSHAVGPMLSDAEGLRTQWANGNRVTTARAQQMDRTQTNGDVFAVLIAEAEEREKHGE